MKKKTLYAILLSVFCFSVISCDLLRTSPFEVVSWTPGAGYHTDIQNIFKKVLHFVFGCVILSLRQQGE